MISQIILQVDPSVAFPRNGDRLSITKMLPPNNEVSRGSNIQSSCTPLAQIVSLFNARNLDETERDIFSDNSNVHHGQQLDLQIFIKWSLNHKHLLPPYLHRQLVDAVCVSHLPKSNRWRVIELVLAQEAALPRDSHQELQKQLLQL